MPVDTNVLAHDMRYFAVAYAIAIGAAFLPLEPAWPKWIVAVVLLADLRLVREGPLRGRPGRRRRGPRAAPLPPARPGRATRPTRPCRGCGSSTSRCSSRSALIVVGRVLLRGRGRAPGDVARRRRGAARPGHRADRHRAAREVQLGHLGAPGQGHAGDGQHHRRDGLPVDDPDGRRARVRRRRVAHQRGQPARLRVGRDRVPLVGRDLHPDGAVGPAARAAACSSAACSTSVYLGARRRVAAGASSDGAPEPPGARGARVPVA